MIRCVDALAGDEYGAVRLGRDVFRLESRTGNAAGLINMGNRPYHLKKDREAALFAALDKGRALTNHHPKHGNGGLVFAPHTITVTVKSGVLA